MNTPENDLVGNLVIELIKKGYVDTPKAVGKAYNEIKSMIEKNDQ